MPAKPQHRYVHYSVTKAKEVLPEWVRDGLEKSANMAFLTGAVKKGAKSSDDLSDFEKSVILLDTEKGRVRVKHDGEEFWFKPNYPCPDCDGTLRLWKKFFRIGNPKSPWKYLCSNHDSGACKSVFPANTGGDFTYMPVDEKTREARKLTNKMFDRLWLEAPDVMEFAGTEEAMKKVAAKARNRAYRFLAAKMLEAGSEEKNVANMQLPDLRIAYKICKNSDISDVMKTGN